jgi:hypothetical protein
MSLLLTGVGTEIKEGSQGGRIRENWGRWR